MKICHENACRTRTCTYGTRKKCLYHFLTQRRSVRRKYMSQAMSLLAMYENQIKELEIAKYSQVKLKFEGEIGSEILSFILAREKQKFNRDDPKDRVRLCFMLCDKHDQLEYFTVM